MRTKYTLKEWKIMSKHFFTKFLMALAWLAAAVLWLLSVILPDKFGFFNLNWAVVVICGTGGLALLFRGLFAKKTGVLKKSDLFWAAALMVIAVVSVIFALKLPKNYIWPIIAVIIAIAGLFSVLATGGKKWDEGDNHKVGYQDYRARKAEEEARKAEEEKKKK
jgi:hypothetical protein